MKALILHNSVDDTSPLDEKDNLDQLKSISEALVLLGYDVVPLSFILNIEDTISHIQSLKPDIIFNLVESVDGSGRLIYFGSAILDYLKIPYTGNSTEAIFLTSNKLIAKNIMLLEGIPTPDWITADGEKCSLFKKGNSYIIKAVWEHASIGMDDHAVVKPESAEELYKIIKDRSSVLGTPFFAEKYIEGREFNLSVISSDRGPVVQPPAEMTFVDYPDDKVRIIGYSAKWHEESFEYINTERVFDFHEKDKPMLDELNKISLKCWSAFGLNGYARVDLRVDPENRPYVLEINANPCINIYSGYSVACERTGLDYNAMIKRLIDHPVKPV
jgi:D-alanine-D-alanine ligase